MAETWELFKKIMHACPHYGLPNKTLLNMFYFGLQVEHKEKLDATTQGAFLMKQYADGYELLERIALSQMQYGNDWKFLDTRPTPKAAGVLQLDQEADLKACIHTLTQQLATLKSMSTTKFVCENCSSGHQSEECPKSGTGEPLSKLIILKVSMVTIITQNFLSN